MPRNRPGRRGMARWAGSPCDVTWWQRMEAEYGRDLVAEERVIQSELERDFLGFFGAGSRFSYQVLA